MSDSSAANFGLLHFGSSLDDEVPEPVSLRCRPAIFAGLVAAPHTPYTGGVSDAASLATRFYTLSHGNRTFFPVATNVSPFGTACPLTSTAEIVATTAGTF